MGNTQRTRIALTMALCVGVALSTGCAAMGTGNGSSGHTSSGVTVLPGSSTVRAGDTQQFTAKVTATMDQTVTWSVNGMMGGNAKVGTISTTGLYKAPAALPIPNSVSIEATSSSDQTLSGKVTVSLENPVPTVTAVSPTAVPVGNFTLTITGTKFVNGAKVMFGGQTLTTKFVSETQLSATGTTTSAQNGMSIQVTVVNPDPGSITSSAMSIKIGASGILVRITPAGAQLRPGETVQFKATVTGTTNSNVVWRVNSAPGGNATVGTISTTGLYTAPSGMTGSTMTIGAPSVE